MTDLTDQERNDFRPATYRGDPDTLEPGLERQSPADEAHDRQDFDDPRVAQPGDDPPDERALG